MPFSTFGSAAFDLVAFRAGNSGSTLTQQTFRQALFAKLQSISELTAIVGSAIYFGALPQTHDLEDDGPALSYVIPSNPREHQLTGASGISAARVHFSAWSYSQLVAEQITNALWNAADGIPTNPWGNGTVTIVSVSQQDETDLPEAPKAGSDQWTYQIVSPYTIRYRTGLPTLS